MAAAKVDRRVRLQAQQILDREASNPDSNALGTRPAVTAPICPWHNPPEAQVWNLARGQDSYHWTLSKPDDA